MSEPNNGDPIGDAPDADPELVRSRPSGVSTAVWRVVVALVAVVLIVALILIFV